MTLPQEIDPAVRQQWTHFQEPDLPDTEEELFAEMQETYGHLDRPANYGL